MMQFQNSLDFSDLIVAIISLIALGVSVWQALSNKPKLRVEIRKNLVVLGGHGDKDGPFVGFYVTNYGTQPTITVSYTHLDVYKRQEAFNGLDESPEVRDLVAASVASDLCTKLQAEGVKDFHFYTLNKAALSLATCRRLGVKAKAVSYTHLDVYKRQGL